MASPSRRSRRLFEPLSSVVVRAPLLTVERFLALDEPAEDPDVVCAIAAASPDLLSELEHPSRGARDDAALGSALLRYVIRMSTRPTPYGLFAGLGVAPWGDTTDLRIDDGPRPVRVRPDMGWLSRVVLDVEGDRGLRPRLGVVVNPCAFVHAGRLHLSERVTAGHAGRPDVSIRVTPVVLRVLALTRQPVGWQDLVARVLDLTPGAEEPQVERLLHQLCDQDLLLSDLRPTLTADPARHLADRLAVSARTRPVARRLARVLDRADAVGSELLGGRVDPRDALARLREQVRAVHPVDVPAGEDVLQVDSALPLRGTVSRQVADDAALAVELLLRMHPSPGGPRHLAGYRAAFVARYGVGRFVPLLELLDTRFGLGAPGASHARGAVPARDVQTRRPEKLTDLATTALHDGTREVALGSSDIDELTTWRPVAGQVPSSVELSSFLVAESARAVDRGDYRLVVGPNLGAQAAGRGLGRFAELAGPHAVQLLRDVAEAERLRRDDVVVAELVYLPPRYRSANVMVRPALHAHEIVVGVSPGVDADHVITPDQLAVWVGGGRLRLWWTARAVEVVVAAGHMLNPAGAPPVVRLLHEIGLDGITPLVGFDWGPATSLPALPRLRAGRVVLRPAQWRRPRARLADALRAHEATAFPAALRDWRARWDLPRHVYLAAGDNRLLLDLDDPAQAEQLRDDVRRSRRTDVVLQEALPGPDDAWLPGPGGHYLSELVVPLLCRAPTASGVPPPSAPSAVTVVEDRHRRRPPGSDWLFVSLYGPRAGQDELVAGPLASFAGELADAGSVDGWFFVRYADPEPHLRFRLHGAPGTLSARVLPAVTTWAAGLVGSGALLRIGIGVYDREVERYGGVDGMALAEEVFAADSVCVADLLGVPTQLDRVELAVLSVDGLLADLGLDPAARQSWYADNAPAPVESGAAFRQRSSRLRELVGRTDGEEQPVRKALAGRGVAVADTGRRLRDLDAGGGLTSPFAVVTRSVVHLHCNRLGIDPGTERVVLGLLNRTHRSLAAAPLTPLP